MIYTAPRVMFFDAGRFIIWGRGGRVGAGNVEFFGPEVENI